MQGEYDISKPRYSAIRPDGTTMTSELTGETEAGMFFLLGYAISVAQWDGEKFTQTMLFYPEHNSTLNGFGSAN
jgi:hypothetical protein